MDSCNTEVVNESRVGNVVTIQASPLPRLTEFESFKIKVFLLRLMQSHCMEKTSTILRSPSLHYFPEHERRAVHHWALQQAKENGIEKFLVDMVEYLKALTEKMPDPSQWITHVPLIHAEEKYKALFAFEVVLHCQSFLYFSLTRDLVTVEREIVTEFRSSNPSLVKSLTDNIQLLKEEL